MSEHKRRRGMTRPLKILTVTGAAAAMAAVALVGTVAAQSAQRFGDVPTGHYAFDSVDWAAENGITGGCGDGTNFCPDTNLNRAHMVTFLKRYHDRFGTGITIAWSEPVDASGGATLTGSGSNLTQAVDVAEGRWRVPFAVEHSEELRGVTLTAFEDGENRDLLVAEFVDEDAYSQTTQFRAGDGILDLAPGRIWFEVSAPVGATWTVTVAPL